MAYEWKAAILAERARISHQPATTASYVAEPERGCGQASQPSPVADGLRRTGAITAAPDASRQELVTNEGEMPIRMRRLLVTIYTTEKRKGTSFASNGR